MDNHRPPALFLADALALDFLNSVATPVDKEVDWIADGEGFIAWLQQAGLVPADALEALDASYGPALPGELDKVATQARALRDWFREFVRGHQGQPLRAGALQQLAPLNTLLESDQSYSRIVPGDSDDAGTAFEWRRTRRWRAPDSLLLPIGEALAQFIAAEDFSYIKACEGPQCTLLFADHTRGRKRRWCSMAICGNRAKVAAHRQRQKDAAGA